MVNLLYKTAVFLFICLFPVLLMGQSSFSNLEFVQNKGQWDSSITFKGDLSGGAFFLRKTGFTVLQHLPADLEQLAEMAHGHADGHTRPSRPVRPTRNQKNPGTIPVPSDIREVIVHSHAYSMDFVAANPAVRMETAKADEGYVNYFIGDDPAKWAGGCHIFGEVIYKDLYPGIDVKYYSEAGSLKYEFIVQPGADPSRILMQYKGVDKLSIRNGELIIGTSVGEMKELAPYSYQSGLEGREKIDSRYRLEKGNRVRFTLGGYDRTKVLIIDPTLVFASLSASLADNWGYTATPGPDGSFFGGGIVFGNGFPVSTGAFQTTYGGSGGGGSYNIGIMKLNSAGTQRVYATYIGGNGKDQPHSMFADPHGNLVIAGRTNSTNYPALTTYGDRGGDDIVITRLNASGTAMLGSMRIGGTKNDGLNIRDSHSNGPSQLVYNYGDDARSEVILDAAGNIYLASCTQSEDFPVTANAVQKTFGGQQDAVLLKLNPTCSAVLYSSYLGGSGYDAGFVLALNPASQDIYMAGGTTSTDLPGSKSGSIQPVYAGGTTDGYISVFSNNGASLKQTTYLGTNGLDIIFGIQFDRNAYPYVMGITTGNWPVLNAAYSNPGSRQFIAKLNKTLSAYEYSTIFGTAAGVPNISPVAFLVDRCENVYVSGWGRGNLGGFTLAGTRGMSVTPDAVKPQTDNADFYFLVLKKNAEELLYATFFGQDDGSNQGVPEHVDGGTSRYDANGTIYQAICANCGSKGQKPSWPSTAGAWCCASQWAPASGSGCNVGMVKIAFNFAGVGSKVQPYISGILDSTACAPAEIEFRDLMRNARSYEWDFGDGSPMVFTTSYTQTHTYAQVGNYRVMLVAVDSSSCNIRDTSYVTVFVKDNRADIAWAYEKTVPCPDISLQYTFKNLSQEPPTKPFTDESFVWDMGDGRRIGPTGLGDITYTYATVGTYRPKLILIDTNYCNAPDSLEKMVNVSPLTEAKFVMPAQGCAPFTYTFENTSLGGQTYLWDFGDGDGVSTEYEPTHVFRQAGTYTVRLTVTDPFTCNVTDDTTMTIVLSASPEASFTYSPVTPVENTPHLFTNNSSPDAIRYEWDLGDGDTIRTNSRAAMEHQYTRSRTFEVCLRAFNAAGCSDDTCQLVTAIVSPRLDVPNAFTPLGPEPTRRVFVRGFAIQSIKFTIYSRQGQKVFETTDINQGWDGRLNGAVLPMDVYAYTLDVSFTDNTRTTKKGDITLIR